MLRSMTSYYDYNLSFDFFDLELKLQSVNSRFLNISVFVPDILKEKEWEIKKILKNKIKRGKVKLTVDINFNEEMLQKKVKINKKIIEKYYKELNSLKVPLKISYSDILNLPYSIEKTNISIKDKEWVKFKNILNKIIVKFLTVADEEGQKLKNDILNHIKMIDENINKIKVDKEERIAKYRKLLLEKVDELDISDIIDKDRLYKEISFYAEKIDINEEITRIKSHLEALRKMVEKENNTEKGKKIKFIVQEMNREINTIGAKVKDAKISFTVVNVKELLEKIKEQSYNIW
ncbi:MAG TPA: YicC/YloC family endoribonuclease [Candidatus Mcinerneyibacterium sp.]|nr:YicC/YloC family endoribonuclease [Candidatus Mcinerneyibacterium sp.]